MANNLFYRNTLIVMRPLTKSRELSSAHHIKQYLHNQFVRTLEAQVKEFESVLGLIATCGDMWSSPNNKMPYFGAMSAHIQILLRNKKRPAWKLKSTILGFKSVEGDHGGVNLGRYYFGMCRRVGIINVEKKISKVCCVWEIYHHLTASLFSLDQPPLTMLRPTVVLVSCLRIYTGNSTFQTGIVLRTS